MVNGPNLNMLGVRDPGDYGTETLEQICSRLGVLAAELGVEVEFFQSNHEGAIIDHLQAAAAGADGMVINPGALTHYGLSLRDAVTDSGLPFVEVHLSDVDSREDFRKRSVFSDLAIARITGLRGDGYLAALRRLIEHVRG